MPSTPASAMHTNSERQARVAERSAKTAIERERLRQALPATVALLRERQADRIDPEDIEAYVRLEWLEWQGGGLRLTITGRNVCAQVPTSAV